MRPAATEDTACNLCGARDYDVVGTADREGKPLRTVMCRALPIGTVMSRISRGRRMLFERLSKMKAGAA